MKIWNVLEKLLADDLNRAFSQAVMSNCTITRNADGNIETIVDTARTPNITYTLTWGIDDVTSVTDGINTWTINRDGDGNLISIIQT